MRNIHATNIATFVQVFILLNSEGYPFVNAVECQVGYNITAGTNVDNTLASKVCASSYGSNAVCRRVESQYSADLTFRQVSGNAIYATCAKKEDCGMHSTCETIEAKLLELLTLPADKVKFIDCGVKYCEGDNCNAMAFTQMSECAKKLVQTTAIHPQKTMDQQTTIQQSPITTSHTAVMRETSMQDYTKEQHQTTIMGQTNVQQSTTPYTAMKRSTFKQEHTKEQHKTTIPRQSNQQSTPIQRLATGQEQSSMWNETKISVTMQQGVTEQTRKIINTCSAASLVHLKTTTALFICFTHLAFLLFPWL